nr:PREDICTED: oocyte zinc finger protein XlCOF19-like [Bemisia tabaci]
MAASDSITNYTTVTTIVFFFYRGAKSRVRSRVFKEGTRVISQEPDLPDEVELAKKYVGKYLCHWCGRGFEEEPELAIHLKRHVRGFNVVRNSQRVPKPPKPPKPKKTPLECDICKKKFWDKARLERHFKVNCPLVPGGKPRKQRVSHMSYQCPMCDFVSPIRTGFTKHLLIAHSDAKPFQCEMCGQGFKANRNLRLHQRVVHSEERPFQCDQCGDAFKLKSILKDHYNSIHNEARPFQCEFCEKNFKARNNYVAHRRIHLDERPYPCDLCSYASRESSQLTRHKRKIHKVTRKNEPLPQPEPPMEPPQEPESPEVDLFAALKFD